jgi:hypothetical protein
MATLQETEKLEKEVFEFIRKGEEAVLEAGRKWAKMVGELAPLDMPAVHELVKGIFDFTEDALRAQREFAQRMLAETRGAVITAVPKSLRVPRTGGKATPTTARPRRTTAAPTRKATAA